MTDFLLENLAVYGLPVYFLTLVISSAGVPFPITLMLVVAGAFVSDGAMEFWPVVLLGALGAVVGDNIGYAIGKYGSRKWIDKITAKFGGDKAEKAEAFAKKWGGTGIFLSRWLITPLAPWLNVTSGLTRYSWPRFLFWDVLGEFLWVGLYVGLGMLFSDNVQEIAGLAGDLTWVLFGLMMAGILGWLLLRSGRVPMQPNES